MKVPKAAPLSFSVVLLLALLLPAGLLRSADVFWNVADGNWSTAANWNPAAVPGGLDSVFILNGGISRVTTSVSNVLRLEVAHKSNLIAAHSGTLSIESGGVLTTGDIPVARWDGSMGVINVLGTGALSASGITVGYTNNAEGTLNILGSSAVTVGGGTGVVFLAAYSGDVKGTLNLGDGTGSSGTLNAGEVRGGSGTAKVNFNHTGTAYTFAPNLTGSLAVEVKKGTTILTGTNSYTGGTTFTGGVLSVSSNNHLGDAAGTLTFEGGTLKATESFTMNRATTINAGGAFFEVDATKTLTQQAGMTGTGGLLKNGLGTLVLTGTHDYEDDTVVEAGTLKLDGASVTMGSNGDAFVTGLAVNAPLLQVLNGASLTGDDIYLGYDAGETGKVLVSGADLTGLTPSSLIGNEDLRVGDWGTDTELVVEAGGYAIALDIYIGHGDSSDPTYGADNHLIVTGNGSLVETQATGSITVGGFGSGNRLTIEDGGKVVTEYLVVGGGDPSDPAFGSNNQVAVRGAGSLLDASVEGLVVGGDGSGNSLLLENGAKVNAGYFIVGGGDPLDTGLGSTNTVTVRTGGELVVEDDITVGFYGSGNTFTVKEGGKAKSGYGVVGWGDDVSGTEPGSGSDNKATVTGAGSLWEVEHDLYVGFIGSGDELHVLSGSTLTAQTLTIGYGINGTPGFGGNNAGLVSGAGTQLLLSGVDLAACGCGSPMPSGVFDGASDLVIGQYGVGNRLTIADGGRVSVKSGTGIVTLAQEAGSGGTLNIGNGGAPGTLEAASVNGGAGTAKVNFNHNSTAFTFAPQLTGSLAVEVLAGTTIFNNPNTYTGGTTITGGILVANNTSGSATGTGDVVLNGGRLGGSGFIAGTVRFNGSAVISPGNSPGTLNMGSLVLGPGSVLDFELGPPGIVGGGVNDLINVAGNLTLDGLLNISDAGGFGTGTYRLINYSGTLTNNGLELGSLPAGVNPGNLSLDVATTGQINILVSALNQQFWDGSQTGANGVIDGGSGVWTATGSNWTNLQGLINGAWAGQTGIFRGTPGVVTLGSDVPFQQLIFQVSGYRIESPLGYKLYALGDAGIEVQTGRVTLAAPTTIAGTFTKSGPGLLDLRSYLSAASTQITRGALAVNGVLDSPTVSVFHGATLMGSGLVIGNVFNHGTVAPGNSIGTLSIDGNYRQYGNGTLEIEVASPGHHDVLVVSGTARLAGTLEIKSLGYDAAYGDQIAFLQAGKITGKFSRIELPHPDTYRGRFLNAGGVGILLVAPTSYTLVAQTPNQTRVASALDQWIGIEDGDIGDVTLALDLLSEAQYPQAFEAILPRYYETALSTAFELSHNHNQLLHQQLSARRLAPRTQPAVPVPPSPKNAKALAPQVQPGEDDLRWNVWMQGSGLFSSGGLSLTPGEDFESGTFLVGADYLVDEHVALGWFASYQEGWGDYENHGDLDLESARFGVYGTFDHGGFYGNAALGLGQTSFDVERPIQWATLERETASDPDAIEFNALLGGGYDFKVGNFTFGPQASLQYSRLDVEGFTEHGAGSLDLRVGDFGAESLRSYLGARAACTINVNERTAVIPEVRVFWQHEYLEGGDDFNATLEGGAGPSFRYETETREEDTVFLGAGINVLFAPRFNASLYYNTSLAANSEPIHSISLSVGYRF